jgi:hypothetical protein
VPNIALDPQEALLWKGGARPIPEMGQGNMKGRSPVLKVSMGRVEDRVAIPDF